MSIATRIGNFVKGAADRLFGRKDAFSTKGTISVASALGPWSGLSEWFVARKVNPHLYEALRESIGTIDGAINRLVTVDGIIRVQGDNDALVAEIEDWANSVPVNDLESGLQAYADSLNNEQYEQGFAIGEFTLGAGGKDIERLRVADSKGVYFRRDESGMKIFYSPPGSPMMTRQDGTDRIETVLRNSYSSASTATLLAGAGYVELDPATLIYQGLHNEADNPYGTSMMRSIEFVAQILLAIQNSTDQMWKRFGDPPLLLKYQTKNPTLKAADLDKRRDQLATNLASTMSAKRKGNSIDLVQAIGRDDDITISVIGAQDKIIEIETPARHMLEQILGKFGLPPWMLGLMWATTERMADQQSEMVLQESRVRFTRRKQPLTNLVATMLRLRGRTWKRGDWELTQELPNLSDELKRAQAAFLNAQTDMMLRGGGIVLPPTMGTDQGAAKRYLHGQALKLAGMDSAKRAAAITPDAALLEAVARQIAAIDAVRSP